MSQQNDSTARRLFEAIKRVLTRIGEFQARVMLTVFYFVIVGPFSLIVRRSNPLELRGRSAAGWGEAPQHKGTEGERASSQS